MACSSVRLGEKSYPQLKLHWLAAASDRLLQSSSYVVRTTAIRLRRYSTKTNYVREVQYPFPWRRWSGIERSLSACRPVETRR